MSWIIDPSHTRAEFAVKHLMISTVRGQFTDINGTVDFNENDPTKSKVDVQIGVASILTRDEKRDAHLKSPDFFEVEKYHYMIFKSKRTTKIDPLHGKLTGDLTIRDVTKEVTLDVDYAGQAKTPWGTTSAGLTATTTINRKDWGLNWNVALETGGVLVGDDVKINLEVEIVKQAEAEKAAA